MARFKGLIQFIGTLGDIMAVNSKEGLYLKSKNKISKARYKKAPEYADFRMNGRYMAVSSKLSSAIRNPIMAFGKDACDTRMYSRMNALMRSIIMCDTASVKGKFTAVNGISSDEGKQLLKDFEFNKHVSFSSIFIGKCSADITAGTLSIPQFVPKNSLLSVVGATHVGLQSGMLYFNFDTMERNFTKSDPVILPIDGLATDVVLHCEHPADNGGALIQFFKVYFMQEVGSTLYALKGNGGAVIKVVGVY